MIPISRRPSLPVGSPVADFPAVIKALHTDNVCEIYLLEISEQASLVLFILNGGNEKQPELRKSLTTWWRVLSPALEIKQPFRPSPAGTRSLEAVLRIAGEWMGARKDTEIEDQALHSILTALTRLSEQSSDAALIPNLEPSLLWKSFTGGETRIVAICASTRENSNETPLVRQLATTFYWIASGIDISSLSQREVKPLSRWCKTATPQISAIIGRCLSGEKNSDGIYSIEDLRRALSPHADGSQPPRAARKSAASGPGSLNGLAKVAGMHALKSLLERDIVKPLRDPEPFKRYGLTIPNGILLYGPPGCGKTYIARQLAEELGYFFVEIIPSQVAGIHVHESVLRIRELFDTAAERAPAIVFIDEFEALVPSRSELGGHQQHKSEEVNEFLAQLNSCADRRIFVIAATNEPKKIDQAIRRTGRLDKLVYVGPPDAEARAEMLRLHLENRPLEKGLAAGSVALVLDGYSASDIKFLVDEAARLALGRGAPISSELLMEASRKIPPSVTKEDEKRYQSFEERG